MKQRIKNWLLHGIGAITLEDVLTFDKGILRLGNEVVDDMALNRLQAEIKALENSRIWQIILETPKQEAFNRGWNKSKTIEELNTGKTICYTIELQKSIINLIKKQKGSIDKGNVV